MRYLSINIIFSLLLSSCSSKPPLVTASPEKMVSLQGGVVKVGGYKTDESHWGDRETFLSPFQIDFDPTPVNFKSNWNCIARGGRLPEEAELNYALTQTKINPGKNIEITQSDINFANTKGGQYNVRLRGLAELLVVRPTKEDINGLTQRRCLIPSHRKSDVTTYTVLKDTQPRAGRGVNWPELHRTLRKNVPFNLIYKDKDWALVDLENDGPDSGGWIPIKSLDSAKVKP
jgi:hypothetical protein